MVQFDQQKERGCELSALQNDCRPRRSHRGKIKGKAFVRLLDSLNYYKYKAGKAYVSASEFRETSLAQLSPPYKGEWNIIVDLNGEKGEIRAVVDVLRSG